MNRSVTCRRWARAWNINPEDVLLIARDASGARSPLAKPRMRFRLRLDSRPDTPRFLMLSLGRPDSPFELETAANCG